MKIVSILSILCLLSIKADLPTDVVESAAITFNQEMVPDDALIDDNASLSLVVVGIAVVVYMAETYDAQTAENDSNADRTNDQSSSCTIL